MKGELTIAGIVTAIISATGIVLAGLNQIKEAVVFLIYFGALGVAVIDNILLHASGNMILNIAAGSVLVYFSLLMPIESLNTPTALLFTNFVLSIPFIGTWILGFTNIVRIITFVTAVLSVFTWVGWHD